MVFKGKFHQPLPNSSGLYKGAEILLISRQKSTFKASVLVGERLGEQLAGECQRLATRLS